MVWTQELQMTGFRIPAYHTIYLASILVAPFFRQEQLLPTCCPPVPSVSGKSWDCEIVPFKERNCFHRRLHSLPSEVQVCSSWGSEGHPLQRSSSKPMEDDANFLHGSRDKTRVQVLGPFAPRHDSLEFRVLETWDIPDFQFCDAICSHFFEVGCNRSRASQKEASRWYACASRALAKYWIYWTCIGRFSFFGLPILDKLILTSFQGAGMVVQSEDLSFLDAHVMAEYGARASCVFQKASVSTKKAAWSKTFECA